MIIDIADLDCVFLSFDEPKKEEFWIKIQNMVPWAKRVDGVVGSDAAHKAAADASDTDRFILIDGDNIPDPEFFNLQLNLDETSSKAVFRWKARNHINGLQYGNGGLSCWTKEFVYNMRTHEASDGSDTTAVEFCFDPFYWAMHDCYSTTYPNQSPFQAWRAGFREGVKMCLDRGTRLSANEFKQRAHARNLDSLCIWQSIGADVQNGLWAILGARLGTHRVLGNPGWDYREVQDFMALQKIWDELQEVELNVESDLILLSDKMREQYGLNVVDMDADQSAFFKHHYKSGFRNTGIMSRE